MSITIGGVVYRNLEDQVQYLTDMYQDLYAISTYMPSDVSTQNKLATRAYVDQSVTTVSAHYLTSDAEGNNFPIKASLISGPYYYGTELHVPDENDYAFVNADEEHSNLPSRYVYIEDTWRYQYSLQASGGVVDLTSAQTISGVKTIADMTKLQFKDTTRYIISNNGIVFGSGGTDVMCITSLNVSPTVNDSKDLGNPTTKWKDLYLNGLAYIGTGNIEATSTAFAIRNNGTNVVAYFSDRVQFYQPIVAANKDLGTSSYKWKDLYLSGEIVGSYKEANTVTYNSGNYVASFTSMDSTTVNKIKYIEVTLEGTTNCVSFNVPVAAINMSEHSVNYEIKTNGYPVESIFILYTSNTLSIAVPHADSTYTAHIFIKFH